MQPLLFPSLHSGRRSDFQPTSVELRYSPLLLRPLMYTLYPSLTSSLSLSLSLLDAVTGGASVVFSVTGDGGDEGETARICLFCSALAAATVTRFFFSTQFTLRFLGLVREVSPHVLFRAHKRSTQAVRFVIRVSFGSGQRLSQTRCWFKPWFGFRFISQFQLSLGFRVSVRSTQSAAG
ncbi:hypothetical protein Hdeb2414_s0017g00503571 [Helianthus debilis subsp. tardiflorus]